MNVRMDGKGFRFRITPEDLHALLADRDLEHRLRVGGHNFGCRIAADGAEQDMTLAMMEEGGFCLRVPRPMLEELHEMGVSRAGLSAQQDGVDISLQVDFKAQIGKAA